ncbi:sugar phosphate isomerase/epimerase [Microlunatus sp. Gsoil 973]|uniref:sugar phosphate isomerase/epimerase family protein n=1 Tax=Microlunatus sp. Gsoil 973 TaxID=2672569 RepID=UPI0012B47ACB|nr:sugar phosphate isomerase/epimerase [Microlunatus sp. Gsoil 973]QGN32564.1 TIM barrel protein [Microlunatus sp. Gsoil 973]
MATAAQATDDQLFPQTPGVVSFTYRREFERDVAGTLDHIRSLGMTDIELSNLFGRTAADIRTLLDERGMHCSSYGVGYADLQDSTDAVAAAAKTLGARFVRVAWVPHEPPFDHRQALDAAAAFNRVGSRLRSEHNLTLCYHNHGYEFVPHGGGTLFDLIIQNTDPAEVGFELDILWTFFPGQDPAQLLRRYPDRFHLMHLKDLRRGVVGDLSGSTARENDVALGDGQLNLPDILRAARESSIEHYYIEDESPSTADQVPRSLAYLALLR